MAKLHGRIRRLPNPGLSSGWRARVHALPAVLAAALALGAPAIAAESRDAGKPPALELPMSSLPEPPPLTLPAPTPDQLERLDEHLRALTSKDPDERRRGLRSILEVEPERVRAIHRRLSQLAESADKTAMKALLSKLRDKARDAERKRMRAAGKRGRVRTPDYLDFLIEYAAPESPEWNALVRVVGMSRMLRQIGSVEATRELIRIYVRFGEFLRVDTQVQLEALGDASLAALIEAQHHEAEKIGRWAAHQLDLRGKAIPSETVQTKDPDVRADILRAYGRIRDPDTARLIVSFANSERAQVRLAAREAVAMLGEVGNWQLRDTYENVVGKRPPREWSWERTARELFTEFDRLRLSRVYRLFQQGRAAEQRGDLPGAVDAYVKVLARDPLFEHREDMASAFLALAREQADTEPAQALLQLRRAARSAADPKTRDRAQSLQWTLEAEQLAEAGTADQVLVRRALQLDPDNERAAALLEQIQRGDLRRADHRNRYAAAGAVGAAALAAIAWLLLRRPHIEPAGSPPASTG